jgi:hypothetical protein
MHRILTRSCFVMPEPLSGAIEQVTLYGTQGVRSQTASNAFGIPLIKRDGMIPCFQHPVCRSFMDGRRSANCTIPIMGSVFDR